MLKVRIAAGLTGCPPAGPEWPDVLDMRNAGLDRKPGSGRNKKPGVWTKRLCPSHQSHMLKPQPSM